MNRDPNVFVVKSAGPAITEEARPVFWHTKSPELKNVQVGDILAFLPPKQQTGFASLFQTQQVCQDQDGRLHLTLKQFVGARIEDLRTLLAEYGYA